MSGAGGPRRPALDRLSRTSSDDPPPMSNRMTPDAAGSNSSVQPVAASLASVAESMISSSTPASSATRPRNSSRVLRGATCRRGDQPCAQHPARAHLVATDQQRLDRARNRRLADSARGGEAFAKANDAGERVDDAEAIRSRSRDQEPAIVGAEIERRIGRAGAMLHRLAPVVATAVATDAVRRSATPASTPRGNFARGPIGVEAARRRGLVGHQMPSRRAGAR